MQFMYKALVKKTPENLENAPLPSLKLDVEPLNHFGTVVYEHCEAAQKTV